MDGDCGRRVRSIGCVGLRNDFGLADDVQGGLTHVFHSDGLPYFLLLNENPSSVLIAMTTYNLQILLYFLYIIFCSLIPKTKSLTFNLTNIGPQYQNINITTFLDAYISSEGLQVTTNDRGNLQQKVGKATYIDLLHLWDKSTGNLTDFYTHFTFVIDSDGNNSYADGFTFFLAPDGSNSTGGGGAMGLPINTTTLAPTSHFVAVEFDTFQNYGWDPLNISPVTHVGIDVSSLTSNVTAVWYCNVTGGIQNEAWIRYDSRSHNLTVVFTGSTNTTRVNDTIHLIVDLRDYLPEWVTFGFSAATGTLFEINNVKSWDFSSSLQTNVTDPMSGEKSVETRPAVNNSGNGG
ncbi:hypothetical protein Vadar_009713 [Vaccinium darrowii]|uniref:Uncharacterized protein n=1 Tax=Vaccinium darrowii TaxID=229202 RepID=A0ACB7WZM2_9ERIC|nr:hypothetical protein Vadar_009713 [Vaccinium darrowii]